jgi:hypothetical protein
MVWEEGGGGWLFASWRSSAATVAFFLYSGGPSVSSLFCSTNVDELLDVSFAHVSVARDDVKAGCETRLSRTAGVHMIVQKRWASCGFRAAVRWRILKKQLPDVSYTGRCQRRRRPTHITLNARLRPATTFPTTSTSWRWSDSVW